MSRELIEATERELESWPGVTMDHSMAGKHRVINLYFRHMTRKVFTSVTPSDGAHGLQNHLGVVRRELTNLGAQRLKPKPSPHRDRERNKPVRPPQFIHEPAETPDDPFAVLAQFKEKTMTRIVTINGKEVTLETGKQPQSISNVRKPKSDFRLLIEAMRPGESVFLPITGADVQRKNLSNIARAVGRAYAYRKEGAGVRIYCTEPKPAKPNGAAKVAQIGQPQRSAWA